MMRRGVLPPSPSGGGGISGGGGGQHGYHHHHYPSLPRAHTPNSIMNNAAMFSGVFPACPLPHTGPSPGPPPPSIPSYSSFADLESSANSTAGSVTSSGRRRRNRRLSSSASFRLNSLAALRPGPLLDPAECTVFSPMSPMELPPPAADLHAAGKGRRALEAPSQHLRQARGAGQPYRKPKHSLIGALSLRQRQAAQVAQRDHLLHHGGSGSGGIHLGAATARCIGNGGGGGSSNSNGSTTGYVSASTLQRRDRGQCTGTGTAAAASSSRIASGVASPLMAISTCFEGVIGGGSCSDELVAEVSAIAIHSPNTAPSGPFQRAFTAPTSSTAGCRPTAATGPMMHSRTASGSACGAAHPAPPKLSPQPSPALYGDPCAPMLPESVLDADPGIGLTVTLEKITIFASDDPIILNDEDDDDDERSCCITAVPAQLEGCADGYGRHFAAPPMRRR